LGGDKEINKEIRSDPSSQASPASPPLPPFFEVFEYTLGTLAGFGAFVLTGAAFWSDGGVFGGGKEVVRKREIFLSNSRQWGKKLGKKKQGTASTHLSGLDHNLLLLDVNSLRLDGRRLLEEVMVVFRGWEGGCEKETDIFLSSSRQWGKKLGKKK